MTDGSLYGVPVVYADGKGNRMTSLDVGSTLENLVAVVTGSNDKPSGHHVEERVAEMAWRAGLSPVRVATYSQRIHDAMKVLEREHTGGPPSL